jgi:hypothetical protein
MMGISGENDCLRRVEKSENAVKTDYRRLGSRDCIAYENGMKPEKRLWRCDESCINVMEIRADAKLR